MASRNGAPRAPSSKPRAAPIQGEVPQPRSFACPLAFSPLSPSSPSPWWPSRDWRPRSGCRSSTTIATPSGRSRIRPGPGRRSGSIGGRSARTPASAGCSTRRGAIRPIGSARSSRRRARGSRAGGDRGPSPGRDRRSRVRQHLGPGRGRRDRQRVQRRPRPHQLQLQARPGQEDPGLVVQPADRDQDRMAPGEGPGPAAGHPPRQPRREALGRDGHPRRAPLPVRRLLRRARPLLPRARVRHLDLRRTRPVPPPGQGRQAPPRHLARRDAGPQPRRRGLAGDVPPLARDRAHARSPRPSGAPRRRRSPPTRCASGSTRRASTS